MDKQELGVFLRSRRERLRPEGDIAELAPMDRNLARRAFLGSARDDATLYGVSDAAEFRHHVVMGLRSTLARYPSDPAVTKLVDELRDASPEFRPAEAARPGPAKRARQGRGAATPPQ